ncbi:pesticidal protein Cry26Aa [Streptomyces lonarensis]|uniref:Pesticidal protein Cry26Aa n=2 Tax=Streptomyces lonarensis TaxID=700599 RepID=A0A7X6CYS6_9ACTN|nr:pesticidal protein Cry26Aa [Streptomyces lonarensis]
MMLLDIVLVVLALSMAVAIGRMAYGPTKADRVVAVEFGFVISVAAIALVAVRSDSPSLFDLVLVMTLVGFLTTMSLAHLVERRP